MASTLIVLVAALAVLSLAWSLLRQGLSEIRSREDWERKRHNLDAQVFRSLLDHDEERYILRFLTAAQFKGFHRRRIRLILAMLRLVEENAGMLIRLGQLARLKRDPELTRQADELISIAIQFRLNLILARPCLYLEWLFPFWGLSLPALGVRYQHLLNSVARLQRTAVSPFLGSSASSQTGVRVS
jgi:hypothetical protein